MAVRLLDRDHGVAEFDQIFLLHIQHFAPDFFGLCLGGEGDDDQVVHVCLILPYGCHHYCAPAVGHEQFEKSWHDPAGSDGQGNRFFV